MSKGTVYPFVQKHLLRKVRKGKLVLETGCGAARYRPILQQAGARYIGTDVHNDHYQDRGDVDVHCSSDNLPFEDRSVDVVFNQGAIDYMPDIHQTLAEAYRILRKGGLLLIYTYDYETLQMIDGNTKKSQRKWELNHHVFTEEQMLSYLKTAGFKATDATGDLPVWSPPKRKDAFLLSLSGKLAAQRRNITNWRAFIARKPRW